MDANSNAPKSRPLDSQTAIWTGESEYEAASEGVEGGEARHLQPEDSQENLGSGGKIELEEVLQPFRLKT